MKPMWCDKCKAVVLADNGICTICGYKGDQYENIFYDPNVQALRRDSLRQIIKEEIDKWYNEIWDGTLQHHIDWCRRGYDLFHRAFLSSNDTVKEELK